MTLSEMHEMMEDKPGMGMRRASWPRDEGTVFYFLDMEWRFEILRTGKSGPARKAKICKPDEFQLYEDWEPAQLGWNATQFRREAMKRQAARLEAIRKARGEA